MSPDPKAHGVDDALKVLPAVPDPPENGSIPSESGAGQTAILVMHGMGQQVPFETLDMVVRGLKEADDSEWRFEGSGVNEVRIGDEKLVRAEVTLKDPTTKSTHRLHIYESYWAPLTEGRVTMRDVAAFLGRSAKRGMSVDKRGFRRWIFGKEVTFPDFPAVTPILAMSFAVFLSLGLMNLLAGAIVLGQAWPGALLRADLTLGLLMFLGTTIPLGVIMGLSYCARKREVAATKIPATKETPEKRQWGAAPRGLQFYRSAGMAAFGGVLGAAVAFLASALILITLRAIFGAEIPWYGYPIPGILAVLVPAIIYAGRLLYLDVPAVDERMEPAEVERARSEHGAARRRQRRGWAAFGIAITFAAVAIVVSALVPFMPGLAANGLAVVAIGQSTFVVTGALVIATVSLLAGAATIVAVRLGLSLRTTLRDQAWKKATPTAKTARDRIFAARKGAKALALAAILMYPLGLAMQVLTATVGLPRAPWAESPVAATLVLLLTLIAGLLSVTLGWRFKRVLTRDSDDSPKATVAELPQAGSDIARALMAVAIVAALGALLFGVVRLISLLWGGSGEITTGLVVAVWLPIFGLSFLVRHLLVQFFGDVAAYVDAQALDKFHDLRREIKKEAKKAADAIYSARTEDGTKLYYDRVLIVGHSLGSLVAYDTLNGLLADDQLGLPRPKSGSKQSDYPRLIAKRTPLLLTFGSPVDRTAFVFATQTNNSAQIREEAAMIAQPLIHLPKYREWITWHNVWSPEDIISSELQFYDDPFDTKMEGSGVKNHEDHWASTPLVAHTEYWQNNEVWRILKAYAMNPFPPVRSIVPDSGSAYADQRLEEDLT